MVGAEPGGGDASPAAEREENLGGAKNTNDPDGGNSLRVACRKRLVNDHLTREFPLPRQPLSLPPSPISALLTASGRHPHTSPP